MGHYDIDNLTMEFYTVFSINFPISFFTIIVWRMRRGGWWSAMLINLVREAGAGADTQTSGDIYN